MDRKNYVFPRRRQMSSRNPGFSLSKGSRSKKEEKKRPLFRETSLSYILYAKLASGSTKAGDGALESKLGTHHI
ncbi:MAG: hypothetical protein IJZ18_04825, partial [Mailhella sp.]|nr:hypothetical protein [Mailhella sp.]